MPMIFISISILLSMVITPAMVGTNSGKLWLVGGVIGGDVIGWTFFIWLGYRMRKRNRFSLQRLNVIFATLIFIVAVLIIIRVF